MWGSSNPFIAVRATAEYTQGFTPNPGAETYVYNSTVGNGAPFSFIGTGRAYRRDLSPGGNGQIQVFNLERGGLPGQGVGGLYTQPLSAR
jgi:hypothetical protein